MQIFTKITLLMVKIIYTLSLALKFLKVGQLTGFFFLVFINIYYYRNYTLSNEVARGVLFFTRPSVSQLLSPSVYVAAGCDWQACTCSSWS